MRNTQTSQATKTRRTVDAGGASAELPGEVVLVLQGGGALGAYQVGVYEALHDAGIEPAWVIGTSIGAINAALIAGNSVEKRLEQLNAFWSQVESPAFLNGAMKWAGMDDVFANLSTVMRGIPGFFEPNMATMGGLKAPVGIEKAAHYSTEPLRHTLEKLVDFQSLDSGTTRLTVGAVNACTGAMRYFDSRDEKLAVEHIIASGALPPAFPAVRIDGETYWDGGIYSNTPIEAVLDDNPRRNSLIFAVNVWHQTGPEPQSIWQVMGRLKDIQFASRADSHLARQRQIHRLRHVIRELSRRMPAEMQQDPVAKELASWGCGTTMHVAHLHPPRLEGEDHTKDIDFSHAGVKTRREAGYADTLSMLKRAPWREPCDPIEGVVEHL